MSDLNRLELRPHHRAGGRRGGTTTTERWSWDFVIDGQSLLERLGGGDVMGALGVWEPEIEAAIGLRLLGQAAPDLPPDRVALYVCPECGDLSCGAITASVRREDDRVIWRDFAWERDWEAPAPITRALAAGPCVFDRGAYGRLIRAALVQRPGPGVSKLSAV
jgi:hypothetical protein